MTFDLGRFVDAQDPVIDQVMEELRAGRKRSHWMWFVFPQIAGLGRSPTAQHYAIGSRAEAQAYWVHPVLGPRLVLCTGLVTGLTGSTAHEVFGSPDDMKFHSSMTLFAAVTAEPVFASALSRYFGGAADPATIRLLGPGMTTSQ